MFDKRNRWIINLILALAVISFTGVAVVLPFAGAFRNNSQATDSASTPTASPGAQQELVEQAKGYEAVLDREPDNQTALRGLLEARIGLGDIEGAIAPLEKLAQLNPDQTNYTILLAQAKQEIGDREGAAQLYRGILAKHPGDIYALQGLSSLLREQNRPEAAIGLLQQTLQSADEANKAQPGSVDVLAVRLLLGQFYAESNRYSEAIAVYDQAIQGNPQDFRPVLGKALVLQTQDKNEEAKPLFTQAASLAPAEYKDQINQLAAGQPPVPADPQVEGDTPLPEAPGVSPSPSAAPDAGTP